MSRGRLIYVVGPSGAGKDSVLDWARERSQDCGVTFAHRYITRDPSAGGENHVHLTPEEFHIRRKAGLFALCWDANGHSYGIGLEIEAWLASGLGVVVNGSRGALGKTLARYPQMLPVLITAPTEILAQRLATRGRENAAQIQARLARTRSLAPDTPTLLTIDNSGPLEQAGERLLDILHDSAKHPQTSPAIPTNIFIDSDTKTF